MSTHADSSSPTLRGIASDQSMTAHASPHASAAAPVLGERIADAFVRARKAGHSLAAFPDTIPPTLTDAYAAQSAAIRRFGSTIAGWKVGRIFPPLAEQFGANRLAGPIFVETIVNSSTQVDPVGRIFIGGFGAAEAEYLLRIGSAPPLGKQRYSLAEAAALVDAVHVGIEIASSPLATINELGPPVIASDFGNNNGLVIGAAIEGWQSVDFAQWPVTVRINGKQVGQGSAAGFPDGPLGSVRFLLEHLAARGIAVPAGTWVSTGAITGVHDVLPGDVVAVEFDAGSVRYKVGCAIEAVVSQGD